MEGLSPFGVALGLVLALELADKTQLATLSLAIRHPRLPVFAGASTSLVVLTAVAVGALLAAVLTPWIRLVQALGGLLFVAFGAVTFLGGRDGEGEVAPDAGGAFAHAFLLNAPAEVGDKTQTAVVVLAATAGAPWSVFVGASLALVTVAAISVLAGTALARVLHGDWLRPLSSAIFGGVGLILLAAAVLGL